MDQATVNYTVEDHDPCVFRVPGRLRDTKPQAYTPQAVGLGPYHHSSPELARKMESQKRRTAKNFLGVCDLGEFSKCKKFIESVEERIESKFACKDFESFVASFYDRHLDPGKAELAKILVFDSIFVLNFLISENYDPQPEDEPKKHGPHCLEVIKLFFSKNCDPQPQKKDPDQKQQNEDCAPRPEGKNPEPRLAVINPDRQRLVSDILMLENQIPLYLLWTITQEFPSAEDIDLFDKVNSFCNKYSPLKWSKHAPDAYERHLLHFMYRSIVNYSDTNVVVPNNCSCREKLDRFRELALPVFNAVFEEVNHAIETASSSGLEIPGNIEKVTKVLQQLRKKSKGIRLAEMIDIPSAWKLETIAKIKFQKRGGIADIDINVHNREIYLPEIHLNRNSEVILRNLVAYEATLAEAKGHPELAEYLDLMSGIIHTAHDVKLLKKRKIIIGDLANEEIVRMFNGLNRSTEKLRKKTRVHKVVQKANKMFAKNAKVKVFRFIIKLLGVIQKLFPLVVLVLLSWQLFYQSGGGGGSLSSGYAAEKRADPSLMDMGASSLSLSPQDKVMIARKLLRY